MSGYHIRLNDARFKAAVSRAELDMAFVSAVVAAGHEIEHARQFDSRDPEMALCHLASCSNEDNYYENYRYNRREIAAEYGGLMSAQAYLQARFPNIDSSRLLVNYVNGRVNGRTLYWISAPESGSFSCLSDIYTSFNTAYDKAADHVNRYRFKLPNDSKDAFAILTKAGSRGGIDKDWAFVFDALSESKDAYASNLVLASAGMFVYPGLMRESLGADLPDLSIRAVFGRDVPGGEVHKSHVPPATGSRSLSSLNRLLSRMEQEQTDSVDYEFE